MSDQTEQQRENVIKDVTFKLKKGHDKKVCRMISLLIYEGRIHHEEEIYFSCSSWKKNLF